MLIILIISIIVVYGFNGYYFYIWIYMDVLVKLVCCWSRLLWKGVIKIDIDIVWLCDFLFEKLLNVCIMIFEYDLFIFGNRLVFGIEENVVKFLEELWNVWEDVGDFDM